VWDASPPPLDPPLHVAVVSAAIVRRLIVVGRPLITAGRLARAGSNPYNQLCGSVVVVGRQGVFQCILWMVGKLRGIYL